ncbi:MAG TPA: hypothetical protein PK692_00560 [Bacteroidales bacterium]|nr:hypothetical protein [Bacteroidales bacterium]HQO06537.1 hypothetical protein [Bacteroidales bacterium]HQP53062.1 hypothetical protein [Bacteroidales bacterium]
MLPIYTRLLALPKPRLLIVGLLLFLLPQFGKGQFYEGYQMEFGRSRVQYKDFFWTYYKFDRFDIYFYLNGKELAEHTAQYVTIELPQMENKLGTYISGKVQFIIFNNLNELKQSNLGVNANIEYNTGGVSHILGNKVVLYFDGSIINFEKQIRQGIAHILLQNSIFGSNISSQMINSYLHTMPEWFTLGLISYLAEEWNTDIDNRIRNAIVSGKYKNFNRLVSDELYVKDAGHSFWKFIADKYGNDNVINIVNMIRVSRNLNTGFQYVLGKTVKSLYAEWFTYFNNIYTAEAKKFDPIPDDVRIKGRRILKRNNHQRFFSQLKSSSNGEHIAFVTNETGKYHIWLYDYKTRKLKKLRTGGYLLDEKVDYSYPILSWHPTGRILSAIVEDKGLNQLYFYDLVEKKWSQRNLFGFEKILDFSYSDNGQILLMSAVQQGQSDIFTFNLISGSYERLTNDFYDDLNPRFIENSTKIVFSSNRNSDTLIMGEKSDFETVSKNYNIFLYNYSTRSEALRIITNIKDANAKQPFTYGKNYLTYLSDKNGIYNQYLGRIDSTVAYVDTAVHYRYFTHSFPITNYSSSILSHDISPKGISNAFIINNKRFEQLFKKNLLLPEHLKPVQTTATYYADQTISGTKSFGLLSGEIGEGIDNIEDTHDRPLLHRARKSFKNVMRDAASSADFDPEYLIDTLLNDQVATFDPEFKMQGTIGINMPDSLNAMMDRFRKELKQSDSTKKFTFPIQRNYYTEYSINQIVTQLDFSYLNQMYQPFSFTNSPYYSNPGFSPTFKIGITDLMEDYRIIGGMRLEFDLVNKEFFLHFANLKNRFDKEIIFQYRNLEEVIGSNYIIRQKIYEGYYIVTWPFNRVLRLRTTLLARNENYIITGPYERLLKAPNVMFNWGGAKIQLIYDDSRELGLNLPQGNKFMIFGEYNQKIDRSGNNLAVLGFDIRTYKRLHRSFIWANRIAGSTNFGSDRLIYFMGGTDGWIAAKFDPTTRIDPDQKWTYQTLATNMRGFKQNARNGNNFIVLNSELRFPLFTYLLNRPINSDILKNFQLVGFGDLGTAWSGWNPYDENNVLYTKYEYFGPLRIKVQYEKDPIVGGVGFGARTKLLGYFIKGDLAWGIEDGKVKKTPMFYFSLSLDF